MANPERTEILGKRLGGLLGVLQNLLQDDMFVAIARLTDRDSKQQKNLTLWSLVERCEKWDSACAVEVKSAVDRLAAAVADIRTHRHKRLAHFDLSVSLGTSKLPEVTFNRLLEALQMIEAILNLVSQRATDTTMIFDVLSHGEITNAAEVSVAKALAYDAGEASGVIERESWRRYVV